MNLMPPYSPTVWKAIGLCVAGLVLIGGVLFLFDKCSVYRAERKQDKLQIAINAKLTNVANLESQKKELELKQAAELESAKRDVEDFHTAVNATVEARQESNAALANVNAARNSNAVNVSVDDLKELLRKLDQ